MKNNWQGYTIAVLTSLMLGGTGSYLVSSSRIDNVRAEMKTDIMAVEVREEKNFLLLIEISRVQAEMLVEMKYLKEALDNP